MIEDLADFWKMLAERYKGIDNKYLAFGLFTEPAIPTDEQYEKILGPSVDAIFSVDPDRVVIADVQGDMNGGGRVSGESMAKKGVAISCHHYEPRKFCDVFDPRVHEQNIVDDEDALHAVTWDYKAEETFDIHSFDDINNPSLNDIRAVAKKYNVGFIVGEFGIFGGDGLSRYRYTDETIQSFFEDMTGAFDKEGIGWVVGGETYWGLLQGYPSVLGAEYVKLKNSNSYCDLNLAAIFRKINGKPEVKDAPYDAYQEEADVDLVDDSEGNADDGSDMDSSDDSGDSSDVGSEDNGSDADSGDDSDIDSDDGGDDYESGSTKKKIKITSVKAKRGSKKITGKLSVKKATVKVKVGKKKFKKAKVSGKKFTFKTVALKKGTKIQIKATKKNYKTGTKTVKVK